MKTDREFIEKCIKGKKNQDWLEKRWEEFEKLIEAVSTGEGALTEKEVQEMRARHELKGLIELIENFGNHPFPNDQIRDFWHGKMIKAALTKEGIKAVKKNLEDFMTLLSDEDQEGEGKGEGDGNL